MTNSSEEQRQNRHKSHSSQGDNNHRMKGGLGIQTNGELRTNKENNVSINNVHVIFNFHKIYGIEE